MSMRQLVRYQAKGPEKFLFVLNLDYLKLMG
jgi:hypothetical protein